jgi:ubiquinone/menaquinone biosynthesis C-methylase UbiE
MINKQKYEEVIQANIELHSIMSDDYSTCEPHFRPENIEKVEKNLTEVINSVQSTGKRRLLDLGCGTGFMINIAKKYVDEIYGVDVTQAMLDKVDKSGNCKINLITHDTGSVEVEPESFDVATAYSFLHHLYDIRPTLRTAFNALKKGGKFYADLDPNFYFWEGVNALNRNGDYDVFVTREIEAVTYKDEDIEKNFGVKKEIFNDAEYGKNIAGGFKEEDVTKQLLELGFSDVKFFYEWYIGQGVFINETAYSKEERYKYADVMNDVLQRALPLSKNLFKYIGFVASK